MIENGSPVVMSREETITYHLEYNMSVPPPRDAIPMVVPACIQAIDAVNAHDLEKRIPLPPCLRWVDKNEERRDYMPAYAMVALFHLERYLNQEWF